MKPTASYDAVFVGAQLGTLLAGALLAKRGFRVLVVGQDELPPTYTVGGVSFPREPFNLLPASSPIARRVLSELALHQVVKRQSAQADPAFQLCLPRHRFELAREAPALDRELEREFSEVKRGAEAVLAACELQDAQLDVALEREWTWPPRTFFERRDLARAAAQQPFGRDGDLTDPLAELPEHHPFRLALELPARFADGMDPDQPSSLRLVRHFSAWRRGGAVLEGGYAALRDMLLESIRTHGGDVRDPERVEGIVARRGEATGVRIAASGEEIGASWVILGSPLSTLLTLVPDRAPFEELFEQVGEPIVRHYRYTLNLRVDGPGVPEGMSRDVFVVRDLERPRTEANALRVQVDPVDVEGRRRVCVEALLPRRGIEDIPEYLGTVRERLLAGLAEVAPFIESHLELIDSPHDGRDAFDVRRAAPVPASEPWGRGPHTMRRVYGYPTTTALGVCALPTRTPLRKLLLCNEQNVPGLGLEGLFLAAWSAARVVSKSERNRDWTRRSRWRRLEI